MKDDREKNYLVNDLLDLKFLYEKFIKDYKEYLDDINANDPFKIFCIFDYMLDNGYLSYNHEYNYAFDKSNIKDFFRYLSDGTCVLTGSGVCRNASTLLDDIYRVTNYKHSLVYVYSHNNIYAIEDNNTNQSLKEQYKMINKIYNPDKRKKLKDKIETGNYELFEDIDNKNKLITKAIGNHMINYALFDDINLFADPTNHEIYKVVKYSKSKIYSEHIDCDIKRMSNKKIKDYYSGSNYGLNKLIKIYESSKIEFDKYDKDFEEFYQREKKLLSEYYKLYESIDYQKVRKYKLV